MTPLSAFYDQHVWQRLCAVKTMPERETTAALHPALASHTGEVCT